MSGPFPYRVRYQSTGSKLLFFFTFSAVQPNHIFCAGEEEIQLSVAKLTAVHDDLSEEDICLEIPHLSRHLQAAEINLEKLSTGLYCNSYSLSSSGTLLSHYHILYWL